MARRELAAVGARRELIEDLERDAETLLEHYASMVPDALDDLTPEERHRVYKMLRLNVLVYADGLVEIAGAFTGLLEAEYSDSVERWKYIEQYSHEPNIATPRFWITHRVEMTEERRLSLETKREAGYAALGVMEGHLTDHDYFVAGRYSIADIALYAYTHVADEGGFDLAGFPAVRAWLERVREQPDHIPITRG